jgi:hypothetical protein
LKYVSEIGESLDSFRTEEYQSKSNDEAIKKAFESCRWVGGGEKETVFVIRDESGNVIYDSFKI